MLFVDFRDFMIFSRSTEIRGVTLNKSHHNFIPAVINVHNATTLEVDIKNDQVYWIEAKAKTVTRGFLNGSHVEVVIDSPGRNSCCNFLLALIKIPMVLPGGPRPTDISIDWISRTIYVTFASSDLQRVGEISVSALSGEYRKTIIAQDVSTPISIAVSPLLGYVSH